MRTAPSSKVALSAYAGEAPVKPSRTTLSEPLTHYCHRCCCVVESTGGMGEPWRCPVCHTVAGYRR